jgi:hypothetical protein
MKIAAMISHGHDQALQNASSSLARTGGFDEIESVQPL